MNTTAEILDPVLSEKTVAAQIGVSLDTMRRIRQRGEIDHVRLGCRRLGYRRTHVETYLDRRTARATS